LRHLVQEWYVSPGRELRNSHPHDIVEHIVQISRWEGSTPGFSPELIDRACDSYFADLRT
jgi:hypothetical protein